MGGEEWVVEGKGLAMEKYPDIERSLLVGALLHFKENGTENWVALWFGD